MSKRFSAADLSGGSGDSHAAEERMQRNVDARSEVTDHLLAIQRNDAVAAIGEFHREKAAMQTEAVAREVRIDIHLEDLHFEDITRLCFGNLYRPGKDMAARSFLGGRIVLIDLIVICRNIFSLHAAGNQPVSRPAGGKGLHHHRV